MKANKVYITALLVAGILVIVNLVAEQLPFRFDFSEGKQYTLSNATKNILKDLTEPVTITAYFSEDLPPDILKTRKDFKEMLIEYSSLSDGMVVYEFINPGKDETVEKAAQQSGIQPVMINVREKDQMKQQKAYLGAVIQLGEQKDVIPFMQPGTAMEYALSTGIKKLSVLDKPSVAIIQGHGEPGANELQQMGANLSILYNVELLNLNDTTVIPSRFRTVVLIRPKDSIPTYHMSMLDQFLSRGGNLVIALNRVEGDLQTANGSAVTTGLESWLAQKGISIEDNFIVDASCGAVTVQQQQGFFRIPIQIPFPYIPILKNFADHPITKGLEAVIMQFASPVNYVGDTSKSFTPIAFTSGKTGTLKAPQFFNVQKKWNDSDYPLKRLPVAGILEGNIVGNAFSRMVVFGDGDFPVGGQRQQVNPDNVSLIVNSIDWLSDDTGLIELRTKGVVSRPIKEMEDQTKTLLKYLNFLLPILLIVFYGLIRAQVRRRKRIKRSLTRYA